MYERRITQLSYSDALFRQQFYLLNHWDPVITFINEKWKLQSTESNSLPDLDTKSILHTTQDGRKHILVYTGPRQYNLNTVHRHTTLSCANQACCWSSKQSANTLLYIPMLRISFSNDCIPLLESRKVRSIHTYHFFPSYQHVTHLPQCIL